MRSYIVIAVDEEPPPPGGGFLVAGEIRRRASEVAHRAAGKYSGITVTDMIFREDRDCYPSLPVDVARPFARIDKAYRGFIKDLRRAIATPREK